MRDKELRKKDEGFVDSYPQWLENRVREVKLSKKTNGERVEIDVPIKVEEVRELKAELQKSMGTKEKLKGVVIRVRKQCNRLRDVNMSTTETLEREIRRAKGEETNKKRYQGALSNNSNELKLRRAERDQTISENMTLRNELKDFWVSKESLKEQLGMMEKNMLVIVYQYEVKMMKEKQDLATIHGQALRNE
ncbi:uncharacterized protein [Glycine max]|uniref:uncharacterized protein n=1 Tax=Glycine max TaxID=3847 RepID=UPI00023CBDD8|nr:uncharacterized protein LOC106795068 [Glycine max]|eukprot:XP_014619088.1 uncharacterized protein LOC106795068 [Glycine max]